MLRAQKAEQVINTCSIALGWARSEFQQLTERQLVNLILSRRNA